MDCSKIQTPLSYLAGKTYLVTGASSGIGQHLALLLDRLGARVVLNGRNEERLNDTLSKMDGKNHYIAMADITKIDCVNWLKDIGTKANSPLSGIAYCAGVHEFVPLRAYNSAALSLAFNQFTISMMDLFMASCKMKKADTLSLVLMSTLSAHQGITGNALYGASRATAESLCRNIAIEFAPRGVHCNCVAGGYMTGSNMTDSFVQQLGSDRISTIEQAYPLGFGHVADAAHMLAFLLSDSSKWITGQTFTVDGGSSIKGI